MLTERADPTTPLGRYLTDLDRRSQSWGVALLLSDENTVPYNDQSTIQVSGYFVETPRPTLAVATGKPFDEWIQILVHEACHMDQWHENAPVWKNNTMPDGREAVDWIDAWCAGDQELNPAELADVLRRAKAVELDCERRALAAFEAYGLDVDRARYAQRANAYVHFYDHVGLTRAWSPPGQAPYQIEAVWCHAPIHLSEEPSRALRTAYAAHYPLPRAPRPRPTSGP